MFRIDGVINQIPVYIDGICHDKVGVECGIKSGRGEIYIVFGGVGAKIVGEELGEKFVKLNVTWRSFHTSECWWVRGRCNLVGDVVIPNLYAGEIKHNRYKEEKDF